jgi:NADH dehydrogenase FAD-containing subunit
MPLLINVVIIGAGHAGVGVKIELLKQKIPNLYITVIETQKEYFWFHGSTRAVADSTTAEAFFFNLDKYFTVPEQGKVVHGKVKQVIVADKTVVLKSGEIIPFDYLVVASGMSNISLMVGGRYETGIFKFAPETKEEGMKELKEYNEALVKAQSICIVGGGPVGIESAAEIKTAFPTKRVTLIHSGAALLHRYGLPVPFLDHVAKKLAAIGVEIVLNEKIDASTLPPLSPSQSQHTLKTVSGKEFASDFTMSAIGKETPNTEFMQKELLSDAGLVLTSEFLNTPSASFIFALGNAAKTAAPLRVLPIEAQTKIIAENIKTLAVSGSSAALKPYVYKAFDAFFLALGPSDGIVSFIS